MGLVSLHLARARGGIEPRDLSHPSWCSALYRRPLLAKLSLGLCQMKTSQTLYFDSLLLPHEWTAGWARAALPRMKRPSPSNTETQGSRAWSRFEQKSEVKPVLSVPNLGGTAPTQFEGGLY